jgi:ParB family chromosome partitioning protein
VPAVICPGPLTVEERRTWQLVENLAREDLQPGELAAALQQERCAILQNNLEQAGISVRDHVPLPDDPVARFEALDKLRGTDVALAAPWTLVLSRLGLQITERRARELIAAFRTLPRELSSEMDEREVSLAARTNLARLTRGRREAANGLWQAVKRLGRTDLLTAAARAQAGDPSLSPEAAAATASAVQEVANAQRSAKLTRPQAPDAPSGESGEAEEHGGEAQEHGGEVPAAVHEPGKAGEWPYVGGTGQGAAPPRPADTDPAGGQAQTSAADAASVDAHVVKAALDAMRDLNRHLTFGHTLHRFDAGSLRLLLADLGNHLDTHVT